MNVDDLTLFKDQMSEDIEILQHEWGYVDSNLSKTEYAFNYWILSRIYSLDEELIPECITEYNDKGIDCFVYFEENKELFIIQNKFYSDTSSVNRNAVSDFLQTPLALLKANLYKKSQHLQNIFNNIKEDPAHKITLHFFATTDSKSGDIETLLKDFNRNSQGTECLVSAEYFDLSAVYELYYGKNYSQTINFTHNLGTLNKGTFASLREEYGIDELYEAYYIVTPVVQLYKMLLSAEKKGYEIFEKNIREYLGNNPINNGIVETLRSKDERKNFMYYNNGITVICQDIKASQPDTQSGLRILPLVNPQIVNGCQTVSSIKKVLENISQNELEKEYKHVYVMVKALVIDAPEMPENKRFYNNVVKYTNKQNAISDKAFTSNMDIFYRWQEEFFKRGFILLVKPSDMNKYKQSLSSKSKADLLQKANAYIENSDFYLTNYNDLCIPLEKLLQVFVAFMKTGYFAFTKKNLVLAQGKDLFDNCSSQIYKYLTVDNAINLYYLYKKAEAEQKNGDKRNPIPYYIIGFLGTLVNVQSTDNIKRSLDVIFSEKSICKEAYKYLTAVCKTYRKTYEKAREGDPDGDYNIMIKRPIDDSSLRFAIESVNDIGDWESTSKWKND